MGAVDQSDVKSKVLSLTRESVSVWHRKQLAFLCETAIINAHANYCLDPSTTPEHFTEWHNKFVDELLNMSKNYRKVKQKRPVIPEESSKKRKRPHRKKVSTPNKRRRKASPYGTPTKAGLACYGSKNLAIYLDLDTSSRWKRCRFCGKKGVIYKCSACGEYFCLTQPTDMIIPGSDPPRRYPANGFFCWHYLHGYSSKTEVRKSG